MYVHPDGSRGAKLFGLAFAALALGLAVFVAVLGFQEFQIRHWPVVACTFLQSNVQEFDGREQAPYAFITRYRYDWKGRSHFGTSFRNSDYGWANVADADRVARSYPVGARRTCHVDPDNPDQAVLEVEDSLGLVALGVAVLLGAAILLLRLYVFPRKRPLGEAGKRAQGLVLGPVLVVLSIVGFAVFSGPYMASLLASQDWPAMRCVVESSKVRSAWIHSGHGALKFFWPDIRYRYSVNGQAYRSNLYNPTDFQTPWYYGKRGITNDCPVGAVAVCYVDPKDPTQAVLTRHVGVAAIWLLWPFAVLLLGGGVLYEGMTGRSLRLGAASFWRRAAIWLAAGSGMLLFLSTVGDLDRDWQAGIAEWPEVLVVVALGIISLWLFHLALRPLTRRTRS
jgi:hypothetical protein